MSFLPELTPEVFTHLFPPHTACLDGMIFDSLRLRAPSVIHRTPETSSVEFLGTLPPEILASILNLLDFQSLSRLSRVSLWAKLSVEALPAYKEFFQHASEVLLALSLTRLLHFHSAALLRQTLREKECITCRREFAGFVFLPTFERVCYECLCGLPRFRVTTIENVKECFGLLDRQLLGIPTLHSISGWYNVGRDSRYIDATRLVSAKQVKERAIQIHGDAENLCRYLPPEPPGDSAESKQFAVLKLLNSTPLDDSKPDVLVKDEFFGVASVRMPYLSNTGVDRGRLCRGCQIKEERRSGLAAQFASFVHKRPRSTRLYSRQGFLHHSKHCSGVLELLSQWRRRQMLPALGFCLSVKTERTAFSTRFDLV
ncbi:hypothetical protein FDECE_9426 [Fusarium decemcellulare]|nr:hypothetical protein FDECE_9426 [Fusarium decemcellulare]